MRFRIDGLNDALSRIQHLADRAKAMDGQHAVSFDDLFPPSFMSAHTDFQSIDLMLEQSGFEVETAEDFQQMPDAEWDSYVASRTRFPSWKVMLDKAVQEWVTRKMGLD